MFGPIYYKYMKHGWHIIIKTIVYYYVHVQLK